MEGLENNQSYVDKIEKEANLLNKDLKNLEAKNPKEIKEVNVDKSLLLLEKKIEFNGSIDKIQQKIIEKQCAIKPPISSIPSFITPQRLDFLERFKSTTNELINDKTLSKFACVETKTKKNERCVEMDLKIGVLDILSGKEVETGINKDQFFIGQGDCGSIDGTTIDGITIDGTISNISLSEDELKEKRIEKLLNDPVFKLLKK